MINRRIPHIGRQIRIVLDGLGVPICGAGSFTDLFFFAAIVGMVHASGGSINEMLTPEELDDYDDLIRDLVWKRCGPDELFEGVLIGSARRTAETRGFAAVSIPIVEAHDTLRTIEIAEHFEQELALPTVAIELPATEECIDALELCIFEGMNASATLIASLAQYRRVADAYMTALEHRLEDDSDVRSISSYAKMFVVPLDMLEDPMLGASACARIAGEAHTALFASTRWRALAANGARVQPLIIESTNGEELRPMELADAHAVLAQLHAHGFNLDAHLEKMFLAALETRAQQESKLMNALEARRRAYPTTAPDVPDGRDVADLGVETFGLPHGYDLP